MGSLSMVCLTTLETAVVPLLDEMRQAARATGAEFVIAADGREAYDRAATLRIADVLVEVRTLGYLESALDYALQACTGEYILRLDDDERASDAMVLWLQDREYLHKDHWKFCRAHLWQNRSIALQMPPLWPDHQTRLSVKAKAGHRPMIHCGSPYGGGELAPVCIEHHKFLVRTRAEREAIVRRYDAIAPGAGTNFLPFQVPEAVFTGTWPTCPYTDGAVVFGRRDL